MKKLKPIEISNTDKACEILHGIDFVNEHEMYSTIAKVEVLLDKIDKLQQADNIIRALAKAESVDFTWILAAQNYVANNPQNK